jgi:hypothetical protein
MVKAVNVRVCLLPSSHCGKGTASSFYRPRGGNLQACCTVLTMCGGMAHSVAE